MAAFGEVLFHGPASPVRKEKALEHRGQQYGLWNKKDPGSNQIA